jgi:uncharacterized delta-60 repeat protein
MILPFGDRRPRIDATAWLPETAVVIGDVVIGPESSLWFHTVVRCDVHDVRIGARTNVKDNATIHVMKGRFATVVTHLILHVSQALALLCLLATAPGASARPGGIDLSFRGTGIAITPVRGSSRATAIVQQADGKLVAAGESTSGGGQARFALVRYNADGTLDPTFGAGTGIVTTLVRGYTNANALVLQPDGKIVAAGYSDTLESVQPFGGSRLEFTLVRYNVDGTIDTTFGRRGSEIATMPSGSALGLVQQEDGRLVAAGLRFFHNRNVLAVVRYLD